MKKVLFISSYNTGYGHQSITEALKEQFAKFSSSIQVDELDGFMLGGIFTKTLSKLYNKVAVYAPHLWGLTYKLGNICPSLINYFATRNIKKNFINYIQASLPDIIITVHPGFVGSIINILDSIGLSIPVAVVVADLDNVTKLWADKRSICTFCPTEVSMQSMVKFGVSEDKIKILGFPIRERFNKADPPLDFSPVMELIKKEQLSFLIMNGSEGGRSNKIAKILLNNFNCKVTILAGRDEILKKSLEEDLLDSYPNRVTICGFIEDVEYYMNNSDILILRASPNVLMEAINLYKPIIVTGAFTGQEEKNPEFVTKNNLGIECKDINLLPQIIKDLFENDGKKLHTIYSGQARFRSPDASKNIAGEVIELLDNQEPSINMLTAIDSNRQVSI